MAMRIYHPEDRFVKTTKNLAIAMGACIFLVAAVLPAKAANENMRLYLSFDSGDREVARDLTGKTKGGDINGGAKIVPGIRGKAMELDGGSGYLQIELTPEMIEAERNSFTAELWLKTKADAPEIAVEQPVKRLRGYLVFGGYGPEEHFHGHWSMFLQNGNNLSVLHHECEFAYKRRSAGRCRGQHISPERRGVASHRRGSRRRCQRDSAFYQRAFGRRRGRTQPES